MSYYAVKVGRNPGVYESWDKCLEEVKGYSGAIYKKFNKKDDAISFIEGISERENEYFDENSNLDEFELITYVDGSYDISNNSYSYGVVLFDNKNIYETTSKRYYDSEDATMRNVAGEVRGAMYSIKRAIELEKKVLYLHYDYAGIENWALKNWKANKKTTIFYRDFYDEVKDKIKVVFIKVKAHSGIKYNEIADKLAKEAK